MHRILILPLLLSATTADAHVGHLADAAGHDHWAIGAAIGVIAVAGLLAALKGKKKDDDAEDTEDAAETA